MSLDNAKRLLEEFHAAKLEDRQIAEQIISENQSLQESKDEFKNDFIESERKQLILEYLCKDPLTWPTLQKTDAKLKASRQEKRAVKKRFEEVKERISDILQPLISEYDHLKEQAKQLEEKVKTYENKKQLFLSTLKLDPATVRIAVEKCQQAVDTLQTELGKKKDLQEQLEASIKYLKQSDDSKLPQIEDNVIHSHAVDWIQNESRLRVLVGNCGKIMYTLAIPEDYPHSRNITLVNTYGTEEIDLNKLPGKDASLLDWVKHLESLYEEAPN